MQHADALASCSVMHGFVSGLLQTYTCTGAWDGWFLLSVAACAAESDLHGVHLQPTDAPEFDVMLTSCYKQLKARRWTYKTSRQDWMRWAATHYTLWRSAVPTLLLYVLYR